MSSTMNAASDTSPAASSDSSGPHVDTARRARWPLVLCALWAILLATIAIALARGQSLRDDSLALPSLAFFVVSALIGSRVWLYLRERGGAV